MPSLPLEKSGRVIWAFFSEFGSVCKRANEYIHSRKCARTFVRLFVLQASSELDKNVIVSLTNNISKGHLFTFFRLAMRLPPYLLFADLLDPSHDPQSIRHVAHFINSYLVSSKNFFNSLLYKISLIFPTL